VRGVVRYMGLVRLASNAVTRLDGGMYCTAQRRRNGRVQRAREVARPL
jgi:hypothetical protein